MERHSLPTGLGQAVSTGVLRPRDVDVVRDSRSQETLLVSHLVFFSYPGVATASLA